MKVKEGSFARVLLVTILILFLAFVSGFVLGEIQAHHTQNEKELLK